MNKFTQGLRIIRWPAWLVAFVLYGALAGFLFGFAIPHDPNLHLWELWRKILFAFGIPLWLFPVVLLVGFVYSDAKRRNMHYVVWTFLAALIPDGIGIILYFLLRDPLPVPCPRCNSMVPQSYSYCPHCGTQIARACPNCRRKIEPDWANCPYCGAKLNGASQGVA
jgi:RNA polymerase subunit RPABC4/transcription elongation factor Spt4